jgi:RNA polymerase sigma-70 factor (ECF subfamily)
VSNTDEELIIEYQTGSPEAFKKLVEKYTSLIYNFTAHLAGKENATDITQETFIKVWKNINKFDAQKANFKTWLFTIARNTATDFLRKKKNIFFSDMEISSDEDLNSFSESIPDENLLPDEALQKLQDAEFLNTLISKLSLDHKTVLILYYTEDMTFSQIGEVLNKPTNTIKSQHRRAILELRKMI